MRHDRGPQSKTNRAMIGLAFGAAAVLLALTALPGRLPQPVPNQGGSPGGGSTGGSGVPNQGSGASSYSAPTSLALSTITSNNVATGAPFRVGLHARPGVIGMVLASSQGPPTTLGGLQLSVSHDWFFLMPPTWNPGGSQFEIMLPVPANPGLTGARLTIQGIALDPVTSEIGVTGSFAHEIITQPPTGRRVLMLRQTTGNAEAPWSQSAVDGLSAILGTYGHEVVVVDDLLPAQLETFDCILDCRYTHEPSSAEKSAMVRYLQGYGGIFLLSGPYYGSAAGQLRAAWIQDLLVTKLGLPLTIFSGGNLSGMGSQHVNAQADPGYLTQPTPIQGLQYDVVNEGGNFGPAGWQSAGTPWITDSSSASGVAYGMLFRHSDIGALRVRGSVAVLFSGSPDALTPGAANPFPDLVFNNLIWFLDT